MPTCRVGLAVAAGGIYLATLVHAEVVAGGGYTHLAVARGTHVRLTDLAGDACAHVTRTARWSGSRCGTWSRSSGRCT